MREIIKKIIFRCGKCDFKTPLKATLLKHCRNEHGENKIKCQDCDYVTGKRNFYKLLKLCRNGQ